MGSISGTICAINPFYFIIFKKKIEIINYCYFVFCIIIIIIIKFYFVKQREIVQNYYNNSCEMRVSNLECMAISDTTR